MTVNLKMPPMSSALLSQLVFTVWGYMSQAEERRELDGAATAQAEHLRLKKWSS